MSETTGVCRAGCSKSLSSKAAAREEARRTLRYVEPLSDARTKLADFFSILRKNLSLTLLGVNRFYGTFIRPIPLTTVLTSEKYTLIC
jgi:hypothetical protein